MAETLRGEVMLRALHASEPYLAAMTSGDVGDVQQWYAAALDQAVAASDVELEISLLAECSHHYAMVREPALLLEAVHRLSALSEHTACGVVALVVARALWDYDCDVAWVERFLAIHDAQEAGVRANRGTSSRSLAAERIVQEATLFTDYVRSAIGLGIACLHELPDQELLRHVFQVRRCIGAGNIGDATLLRSIEVMLDRKRLGEDALQLVGWVWADRMRIRQFRQDFHPGDDESLEALISQAVDRASYEEFILIASIHERDFTHARSALTTAGIEFGGRRGRGVVGFRVRRADASRAIEVLRADSQVNGYEVRFVESEPS